MVSFFFTLQMECIALSFRHTSFSLQKPVSTFRKFLSKILGGFYFIDSVFLLYHRSLVLYLAVPTFLAPGSSFMEDNFSIGGDQGGWGMASG